MTRLSSSLWVALSLATVAVGCGEDENLNSDEGEASCEESEQVGEDCTCGDDDESEGSYVCEDDELECVCEDATGDDEDEDAGKEDEDDEPPKGTKDAGGKTQKDAGDGKITAVRRPDAGGTGTKPNTDAGGGGGTTTTPPPGGGAAGSPVIPEISGECPEFKDGTVTVAGHKGVSISAREGGKNGAILFYWHGTGGSAAEAALRIPAAVREEILGGGGLIVAFTGSQSAKTGSDCSGTGAHNQSDFAATDQIVACAVKNHGIDPHRIYTTGCSAGGLQSGCMATLRSSYVAAAAPNSGGIVFPLRFQDNHVPALFSMHGGSSDVVIVTFSETSATLNKQFKDAGGFVVNCNHNGSHCGASGALLTASWKFMNEHPFGVSPSPWASGIPSGVPDYCKIF